MVKQKRLLVTLLSTVILAAGAVTIIVKDIDSSASDRGRTSSGSKKGTSSSSSSSSGKQDWEKNAQAEGVVADDSTVASSSSATASSSSSSEVKGDASASASSSTGHSQKGTSTANTLTEDDFRSSDELAYRMITLYGLVNGDASWKALKSASSLTMTRQSDTIPTFLVTNGQSGKGTAYYRYVMSSNDTEVQDKPLCFSKNDAKKYRASVEDVVDFVNAQGGRAVVERLNFKLVN
ncbi:hypothetical protein IV71_GL000449 [Fructobacillus fructosus KCTC 3544]|uniref:Lipoprotein n=1 Tax=Fructobacillus fructosus TaxID=1631 RepID=A0ABN9YV77_9LACO|nr:hypothetical protein [Fructobacillus fructosus]KRN51870.1 hypothetical protein IV71_GL000449 [Fructobacillus fructosus KCTC 3544]CAK1247902.1 unnamed protein product [Fructobacillus fructosus]